MNRILILCILAIGFFTFAVDSSSVILQAKKIRETSVVLSWSEIPDASQYKVIYDENTLIDPKDPSPLLSTDFTSKQEIEISALLPNTHYYFIVYAYDRDGNKLDSVSLPLHAKTYSSTSMDLVGDPFALDNKTIILTFTRPIDVSKTEIEVYNNETQKARTIESIKNDTEDLRIVSITLKGSMVSGVSHEIRLKKVISMSGLELPADKRTTTSIAWTETVSSSTSPAPIVAETPPVTPPIVTPPVTEPAVEVSAPQPILGDDDNDLDPLPEQTPVRLEPVPIDQLPQTGPLAFLVLLFAAASIFVYKKSSQRIES